MGTMSPSMRSFATTVGASDVIGLLQRVKWARVSVAGQNVAAIGPGLLVLVGVERGDSMESAERLAERLLAYRVSETPPAA